MDIYAEISAFYRDYTGEKTVIGTSCEGREIYAFFVGEHTFPVGISQYAIHAREWVTALLGLYHVRVGCACGGTWFVPLMNPDGALLSETGVKSVSRKERRRLRLINGGEDFSLWKANARAVDLNLNFDARWGSGRGNLRVPAPSGYIGENPLSEPESRSLAEFTLRVRPDYTLSFHTKGEELYWRFHQSGARLVRDRTLAGALQRSTGYAVRETPYSAGGYKDWCVEKLQIPAFTVEAGSDDLSHPLGRGALGGLIDRCGRAVYDLSEAMRGRTVYA